MSLKPRNLSIFPHRALSGQFANEEIYNRVDQLEEQNAQLQREISTKRKEIVHHPEESLVILSQIEQAREMMGTNTEEILRIYREME